MSPTDPAARAAKIKLLVLDVDGVLTPGTVTLDHQGRELKFFNIKDGHGMKLLMRAGFELAWLSGRSGAANRARAEQVGVSRLIEDAKVKLPVLTELVDQMGLAWEQVAFMGDDLIDLPPMRAVGLALAPADAIDEVLQAAHWVSDHQGGRGAVRQACEFLLKAAGKWEQVTARYF